MSPAIQAMLAEKVGFAGGPGTASPLRINYRNVSLKMLIGRAYGIRPDQITGPGWIDTELYEMAATLPPGTDAAGLRLMLQGLLKERFALSIRQEHRVLPVYLLTVAKGGPKLAPPDVQVEYKDEAEARAATKAKAISNLEVMKGQLDARTNRRFHMPSQTLEKFAETLSSNLDRAVRDRTGLHGTYAFTLAWLADGPNTVASDQAGPSIFAVVQEQLGLKSNSSRTKKKPKCW